ncbi:alpha/beta hydrolase [Neptunitalea lumnitzerae]|uniref:Histidine kinase n=1 Tax=Neptunitalea lumnitzerae TaxID=2965509 RepID=A0ABQ5MEX5_9FLAO|nr:alpha/beta hydrolase-fold protein [Neptunitalea sp. Y10]GLB47956.1 histidine kinase [Neptunitalea sp. Y10]
MKKILLILPFLCSLITNAQVFTEEIESGILEEKRTLKIHIPANYTETEVYPLIIVLDADYLFDPVVANINYLSYFNEMPEAIVVGVNQFESRYQDMESDPETGLPKNIGAYFFDFIGIELIPYIESKYTVANFRMAVGHDLSAAFINYYLLRDEVMFNAYICMNPTFAPKMEERVAARLATFNDRKFYYMATAESDDRDVRERVNSLHQTLDQSENKNLYYYFDDFKNANHNTTVIYGLPNALNDIFSIFKPITPKEYQEKILTMEEPVINYLYDKYNTIENLFGFEKEILINDFMAIYAACRKKEDFESLEKLGALAERDYPKTMMADYFYGEYYERIGKPKKALKHYQDAFAKEEIDFMTKDLAYEKMQQIKIDFGL